MPVPIDVTLTVTEAGRLADSRRAAWLRGQIALYGPGEVRIQISRPKRTTRANAFYWSQVIEPIRMALLDAGQAVSAEALHYHFKAKYLPARAVTVMGMDYVLTGSTAELDSTSFSDYLERIREDEDVLTLGVFIPEPDANLRSFTLAEP